MLTRAFDVVFWCAFCVMALGSILPLLFRRHEWVRGLGVSFILAASLFAVLRAYLSPRMAIDYVYRLQDHATPTFSDGVFYTWHAVLSACALFVFAIGGLSLLALLPPKR
jgi:hypothetical protein